MTRHWISCHLFTVRVTTDADDIIVQAAPIVKKFIGQPIANLIRWASTRGGLSHMWEEIDAERAD